MPTRTASAQWQGTLREGQGTMRLGSGAFEGRYSFTSRFEEGPGTNPEELIGAAHAGCFSMALAGSLTTAGFPPNRIDTTARVRIERQGAGFKITNIDLQTDADVPNISNERFQELAQQAKTGCPVSQALAGTQINLQAKLTH